MAYAITILAIYPEYQDWIIVEIDHVSKLNGDLDYERTFPAMKRCLALMYENLRLCTPVAHIAKSTASPQQICTSSRTFYVPADTKVPTSMHVDTKIWGCDSLSFRPFAG
ncbi:MAG: hypothetical protein FRX48_06428 [Lasallia pustulata]|uniref:Uncharacterized protein n=1 Tax=Lasallia pustulata TaxID=136370 RepID=A0A5M8PM64_9LECA|nr:MAG: hypothetical protein FRX48_06428 [Lasallia pustulata]